MRTLIFLGFVGLLSIPACGSSSNNAEPAPAGGAGAACSGAQECNPDQCVCGDGESFQAPTVCLQNTCGTGNHDSFCGTMCKDHGGVTTVGPSPNVATSVECDAWCNKGAALGCGTTKCERYFFCGIGKHSCEAAARAALDCSVQKGKWACSKQGGSWSVSSSCGTFDELCVSGGDAGTD